MRLVETTAKSIITESKLPDADYVINPYIGCIFGCAYCYASFMGRFVNEPTSAWGDYVYVKTNAVDLVDTELAKMTAAKRQGSILLSSVTDPYQGAEANYQLTRGILQKLGDYAYPGLVGILTKSPIVTRDIDMLARIPHAEVGITVTSTDDRVSRWLEVRAPIASRRLRTLAELSQAGVSTYAFIGPLLPHFAAAPGLLDDLFGQLAAAGVREVYVEHINLKKYIRERLEPVLESEPDSVRATYLQARSDQHRQKLNEIAGPLLLKHGLRLRLSKVLYHNEKDNMATGAP